MILLMLSVAGFLLGQIQRLDTGQPHVSVAVAVVGPSAGQERMMQETLDTAFGRELSGTCYRLYHSDLPFLWSVLSDHRVVEDTAILGSLDAIRKLSHLDVLIATFVLRPDSGQVVVGAAVFTVGARGERGQRFSARGSTLKRALRNIADVVAADLRRHDSGCVPATRAPIASGPSARSQVQTAAGVRSSAVLRTADFE